MRKISENKEFPFLSVDLCYYELADKELIDLSRNEDFLKEAYNRAKNGKSKLYVSWHGKYRTDMFEIDDLSLIGQAFGFKEKQHIHDIEWKYYNNERKGSYVYLDVNFKCGCTFDGCDGIRKLKKRDFAAKRLGRVNFIPGWP